MSFLTVVSSVMMVTMMPNVFALRSAAARARGQALSLAVIAQSGGLKNLKEGPKVDLNGRSVSLFEIHSKLSNQSESWSNKVENLKNCVLRLSPEGVKNEIEARRSAGKTAQSIFLKNPTGGLLGKKNQDKPLHASVKRIPNFSSLKFKLKENNTKVEEVDGDELPPKYNKFNLDFGKTTDLEKVSVICGSCNVCSS